MGGLLSTKPTSLTVKGVNETINGSIVKFTPTTQQNTNATNYLKVGEGGTAIGNVQLIEVASDLRSLYEASQTSDFKTRVNNEITQDLNKQSIALISDIGGILTNKNINLVTEIQNKTKNLNISEIMPTCINNQSLVNEIIIEKDGTAINNVQGIKGTFYQECMNSVKSNMNTVSDITNTINQKATIEEKNPLGFLSDMFGNLMPNFTLIIIVFIILVVCGITIAILFRKRRSNKN